ncbi:hypothetical protein AVEN_161785-1 [Araneus ventricosus]|uniref:Uncharacterized protein n=1 Tax=Araneus ventricosus TaxID=182803 RepID=A0A4Y2RAV8_ARAVE|nr:hypothetical protein AVEN_169417-1 [Araneus ventricosus]GBN72806.1 hypothetical protein AVEN_161785-1 [Araneus ventricosus]
MICGCHEACNCKKTRGGLVHKSRLWEQKVPGSKPDSTKTLPCMDHKSHVAFKRLPAGVVRKTRDRSASSGAVLLMCPRFKITMPVPK